MKPATICGYRDEACKRKKEKEGKIGQNFTPSNDNAAQATDDVARKSNGSWLGRLGRAFSNILPGLTSVSAKGKSFLASDSNRGAGNSAPVEFNNTAVSAAPAMPPPSFGTLVEAKLDPRYRVGGSGEDLFSGNYNFTLSLVNLPARAGMNLNIPLSLNSVTWIKYGNTISYDYDYYPSLTPGFRTGFPEIEGPYLVNGASTYIVYLPSGRRVEMRQVATNRFEAIDSSYLYLEVDATDQTKMTLFSTDGTQCKFEMPITYAWSSRCTQIKDSNGNYISITYKNIGVLGFHLTVIDKVIDTLGREIVFNYDDQQPGGTLHLMSITQNQTGQPPFYWAQFDYSVTHVTPNFGSLIVDGPNNVDIPVITRIITADGARHTFAYNSWGQVNVISSYGEADNPRTHTIYAFPGTGSAQSDCPRFTQRNDGIFAWPGEIYDPPSGFGWGVNYFYFDPNEAFGQMTGPDGVTHKEIFGTSGGLRGLTTRTEAHHGGAIQQFTDITWASDSASSPPLRPRMTETKICDDKNHTGGACEVGIDKLKKTTIEYTTVAGTIKLPRVVRDYNEGGGSVYRSARTEYLSNADYINNNPGQIRRIVGLPNFTYLYEGDQATLKAQTEYIYDSPNGGGTTFLQGYASVRQHDTMNYGAGFQFRGNLTKARRYSVSCGVAGSFIDTMTGYYITGNPACTKDGGNHETTISYDDSFLHYTQPTPDSISYVTVATNPPTYAYPTKVTVDETPADLSSTVSYNYDFGAITRAVDPKGYAAVGGGNPQTMSVNTYDTKGRLEKALIWKDNAKHSQTRYAYGNDHNWVQTATTVNSLAEETAVLHLLDGVGRERIVINEHPGSQGGLSSYYRVFDKMGRVAERSRPTEIDSATWLATGDDSEYIITSQSYDWKGRPTDTTFPDMDPGNPVVADKRTRKITYEGCGCAGQDIIEYLSEEMPEGRRKTKVYRDILGRVTKTESLDWNGGVYSTTTSNWNALDQTTSIKQYQGAGDGVSCPLGTCQETTTTFDGYGRVASRKNPIEDAATTYEYNNDDTLNWVRDARGAKSQFSYNNRKQIINVTYSDTAGLGLVTTPSVSFQYDELGNRTLMDDGPGFVSYGYNSLGQLTSEARTFDMPGAPAGQFTISYLWGLAGQLTKITDPFGAQVDYTYDKTSRPTRVTGTAFAGVTTYVDSVNYRAWGDAKTISYGSQAAQMTYNSRMLPTHYELGSQASVNYKYHNDGKLKEVIGLSDSKLHQIFDYDHQGRTRFAKGDGGGVAPTQYDLSYNYDAFGNPVSRGISYWYTSSYGAGGTYQNNRMTTANEGGTQLRVFYDQSGNVTKNEKQNPINQQWELAEVFRYDIRGQAVGEGPVSPTNPDQTRFYDGDGAVIALTAGSFPVYHLKSSVLEGRTLTTILSSGQKLTTEVFAGKEIIATQCVGCVVFGVNLVNFHRRDPQRSLDLYNGYVYMMDLLGIRVQPATEAQINGGGGQNPPPVNPGNYYSAATIDSFGTTNNAMTCRRDGTPVPCDRLLRDAANGGLSSVKVTTTGGLGGVGGGTGAILGAFSLAAGQAASTMRYLGTRRIDGERIGLKIGEQSAVWDTPPKCEAVFANDVNFFFGQSGGQSGAAFGSLIPNIGANTWTTANANLRTKLENGFKAIQNQNCKDFVNGLIKRYAHKLHANFEDLLKTVTFHLYNGNETHVTTWAGGGAGYKQLQADVSKFGGGTFEEAQAGLTGPFGNKALTLGKNTYLNAYYFAAWDVNAGVLIVHEILHAAGIKTSPRYYEPSLDLWVPESDPIMGHESEIKKICAPKLPGN